MVNIGTKLEKKLYNMSIKINIFSKSLICTVYNRVATYREMSKKYNNKCSESNVKEFFSKYSKNIKLKLTIYSNGVATCRKYKIVYITAYLLKIRLL